MSFIVAKKIVDIKSPNKVLCKTTKSDKYIGVNADFVGEEPIRKISLEGEDQFQILPNPNTEREILYICGASGSGKSYFTKNYLKEYKKMYPKNKLWLISVLEENEFSKEGVKKLNVEKMAEALINIKDVMKDLSNSLIIFDDSDSYKDKAIKAFVWSLLDNIAQTGRHFNISMVVTSHLLSNYSQTKIILLESHKIVVFMNNYNQKMKIFLENYANIDKFTIDKLRKIKSRWVCLNRHYPISYITEQEAGIVNTDSQEINDAIAILEKKNNNLKMKPKQPPIIVNSA